jgi:YidC/Oxa1 family membrane protein insertase
MIAGIFEFFATPLAWFYSFTHNYAVMIGLIAVVVMLLVTPLILKSTRGMLEMQRLAPEMRKLQTEYRDDRQKLNEEMMKLYQEHKVNPMASCLPLVAQMPVFIIMFRVLTGMTYRPAGGNEIVARAVLNAAGRPQDEIIGFVPRYLNHGSELYDSLLRADEMNAFGLDLSVSPAQMLGENFAQGLIYAGLVAVLGLLYFGQQRMVAARAAVSPTMSPAQQKLMQYLPVAFAVFQIFFLLGLVVYYIVQSCLRILQQFYITKRFYGGDDSLGRQAQAASERARELAKADGGGGPLAQARRDLAEAKKQAKAPADDDSGVRPSKRTTQPKNRPTPNAKRPSSSKPAGRGGTSRPSSRPSSSKKKRKR